MSSSSMGRHFGKFDLDRVGYFDDPPPGPFDKFTGPLEFRAGFNKGRQIQAGSSGDFFEKKFLRIFEGEAIHEAWREKIKEEGVRAKGQIGGRLLPPSPGKKHSTSGDWYGCFDKPGYLRHEETKRKKLARSRPNIKIKPNPLGGAGYADICINPYPSYSSDPYDSGTRTKSAMVKGPVTKFLSASVPLDYFPPNPYVGKENGPLYVRPKEKPVTIIAPGRIYIPFPKDRGSQPDGSFHKYPPYMSDPYETKKYERSITGEKWLAGGPNFRSKCTVSVVQRITQVSCHAANYNRYRERAYPLNN